MISRSLITAFITEMNSLFEFFLASMSATFRADLRSIFMVYLLKVFSSLPTYPRQQISELTKTSFQHMFTQESFGSHLKVDVLNKNHVCLVTEKMASLKVKILTSISNFMVKSWAFYQLRNFLEYKGIKEGVEVLAVNPAYTSQTCHCCLNIGLRSNKSFRCSNKTCGWIGDADDDGSKMIAKVGLSVNQAGGSQLLACEVASLEGTSKASCDDRRITEGLLKASCL